jgi:16S rRNA (cytosine967-C5)-methyltransferase
VLGEVLEKSQSLKGTLQREQRKLAREDDRALLRELAAGVVRNLPLIDWALDDAIERGLSETQAELLQILRVGAYQVLYLDRVPVYAAVDECVKAAKELNPGAGGFVNGVLRSVAEKRGESADTAYTLPGAAGLALRYGMPDWLVRRYVARFGEAETEAILSALDEPAPTAIVFPSGAAAAQGVPQLQREGITAKPDPDLPLTYLADHGNPAETEAFKRGLFYVMDPASQGPALLLPLKGSEAVLDVCAAPGGKTVLLSGRLKKGGWVLAADSGRRRMAKVRENVSRLGLTNVRLALADAEKGLPFRDVWQAVLLDAPCSALGTLRRNPEIRWQIRETAPSEMAVRQLAFLSEAARVTAKGGLLCYSVCSFEEEETSGVVDRFVSEHPDFDPEPVTPPAAWKDLVTPAGAGRFYLMPHSRAWDGFFISVLRRRKRR